MNLIEERKRINLWKQEIVTTKQELQTAENRLQAATTELADAKSARDVLQLVAKATQQRAHSKLAEVVSSCLSSVFDDPYEFHIEFAYSRGKTEATLRFSRRGLSVDPMTASGGGMIDVAAFALRIACIMLHRPKLSRVVVIDEGFKFVSAEYRDNIRQMLEEISEKLRIQIIQVTHIKELEVGNVITI